VREDGAIFCAMAPRPRFLAPALRAARAFLVLSGLSSGAVGCGSSAGSFAHAMPDASTDAMAEPIPADARWLDEGALDADAGGIVVLAADPDAAPCVGSAYDYPGLTCFGSDPAPYLMLLVPESGVAVGQCPAQGDFLAPRGEGAGPCGSFVCGPLQPAAVAKLKDAAPTDADGGVCCYWARQVCGV
jgi:hypothetical protein